MKIMNVILSSILFCSILSLADIESFEIPAFLNAIHARDLESAQTEGGFSGQTKIKISDHQFCNLEDLETGDLIYSPKTNGLQEIVLSRELNLPYYFEIESGGLAISAAPAQLFHDELTGDWVQAQNLTAEHVIGGHFVDRATRINSRHKMYKLNVEDELFIIDHDNFLVHNEALAFATAAGMQVGRLMLLYPVAQAIGRTISVQKIWNRLYNLWGLKEPAQPDFVYHHYIKKITEKARSYYTVRRAAMLDLLQKYRQMQQIVETVLNQRSPGLGLFNPAQNHSQVSRLLPSFEVESKYSCRDQQKLLQLRDQELVSIEQEIVQIQFGLGLYFDEILNYQNSLGDQLRAGVESFSRIKELVSAKILECRRNRNVIRSVQGLLQQQYLQLFSIDVILHHFIAKSEGWSVIAQLYFNHPQTALFRESSNVLHSCGGLAYQETVNMPHDLKAQIPLMRSQFQATEQLMKQFGVRVHHPSIKAVVQKAQVAMKKSEEKHRQNIRVKKSKIKKSPPPNDPDPDDEEDKKSFFDKLKKRHKGKVKAPKGLMFEDPDTGLWWGRDVDRHSGLHYKVYRAMKKGFKWIMDADFWGKEIINKHKGPSGKFISYKEVVNLK